MTSLFTPRLTRSIGSQLSHHLLKPPPLRCCICHSTRSYATKRSSRTKKLLTELPQHAVDEDGLPKGPLGPPPSYSMSSGSIATTTEEQSEDEVAWNKAVLSGEYPSTPLAREVFMNHRRYPDDILLTRVGMFYESYFTQAPLLASLLDIRLTSKKFNTTQVPSSSDIPPKSTKPKKSKSSKVQTVSAFFPFSGFPAHQKEKFIRLLLEQGRSVVIVEEREAGGAGGEPTEGTELTEIAGLEPSETPKKRTRAKKEPRLSITGKLEKTGEAKERFVSRKLTPGTLMSENWNGLDDSRYLMAVSLDKNEHEAQDQDQEKTGVRESKIGLAYIDISTDRALTTKTSTLGELEHELARIGPVEVVLDRRLKDLLRSSESAEGVLSESHDSDSPEMDLLNQVRISSAFVSFVIPPERSSTEGEVQSTSSLESKAVALAEKQLRDCLMTSMPTLLPPNHQAPNLLMRVDASTLLGLEIRQSIRHSQTASFSGMFSSAASRAGTLLGVVKRTLTPSGSRLLVNSLCQPSAHLPAIVERHDLVEAFYTRRMLREDLRDKLRATTMAVQGGSNGGGGGEVGRILQKFLSGKSSGSGGFGNGLAFGRDLWDLKSAVEAMGWVQDRIGMDMKRDGLRRSKVVPGTTAGPNGRLAGVVDSFNDLRSLAKTIDDAVVESALNKLAEQDGSEAVTSESETDEGVAEDGQATPDAQVLPLSKLAQEAADKAAMWWIKPGFSKSLSLLHRRHETLLQEKDTLEQALREKYNSPKLSLKNGLLGYIVECQVMQCKAVDKDKNFVLITQNKSTKKYAFNRWTALGIRIQLTADDIAAEQRIAFETLRDLVCDQQEALLANSKLLDEIDLTLAFAQAAEELRLVRPSMNDGYDMDVVNGRHPTVELSLMTSNNSRPFVPNSLSLTSSSFLHVITGCNMGGKSTVLRQTAIIAILAQAGCWVPAESASIGVIDAVFSRVGARDELVRDRSTFMVEMHETAHILREATPRSLVIMDEIGRGTTPLSGTAIAYATLDYILREIGCKTLFATHFHGLEEMLKVKSKDGLEVVRPGVGFWCTDLNEVDGRFSYSYKLRSGLSRESHAIKTAQQAGMPLAFLSKAQETLTKLENDELMKDKTSAKVSTRRTKRDVSSLTRSSDERSFERLVQPDDVKEIRSLVFPS